MELWGLSTFLSDSFHHLFFWRQEFILGTRSQYAPRKWNDCCWNYGPWSHSDHWNPWNEGEISPSLTSLIVWSKRIKGTVVPLFVGIWFESYEILRKDSHSSDEKNYKKLICDRFGGGQIHIEVTPPSTPEGPFVIYLESADWEKINRTRRLSRNQDPALYDLLQKTFTFKDEIKKKPQQKSKTTISEDPPAPTGTWLDVYLVDVEGKPHYPLEAGKLESSLLQYLFPSASK